MATFELVTLRVADFLEWDDRGQLRIQPKFQRRPAWEPKARSYLIDTVVRGLPMPKVYIRQAEDAAVRTKIFEVVDGQQRLRAIRDFYHDALVLSKRDHPQLGGGGFSALPDSAQRLFLDYQISTEIMHDATDPEVWSLFERLNTYTLTLNRQEKLNAKFFGYFKQIAYELAAEAPALEVWRELRVFTNRQIARMKEVEHTSDVLVAIVRGISDIVEIAKAYEDFDDAFAQRRSASRTFRRSLDFVRKQLAPGVRETRFRNRAWFYSIMVAVADAFAGIPNGSGPLEIRSGEEIVPRMRAMDDALKPDDVPAGLADLKRALSRATSHVPERKIRHRYFLEMLTLPTKQWDSRWESLLSGESREGA